MQLTIGILIAALGGVLFVTLTGNGPSARPLDQAVQKTADARAEALELAFQPRGTVNP